MNGITKITKQTLIINKIADCIINYRSIENIDATKFLYEIISNVVTYLKHFNLNNSFEILVDQIISSMYIFYLSIYLFFFFFNLNLSNMIKILY